MAAKHYKTIAKCRKEDEHPFYQEWLEETSKQRTHRIHSACAAIAQASRDALTNKYNIALDLPVGAGNVLNGLK